MRQLPAALAILFSTGCQLGRLDPYVDTATLRCAHFTVEGIGVCCEDAIRTEGEQRACLLVRAHRTRGRVASALDAALTGACCFSLAWPDDPVTARAMGELFASEPIGAIGRCAIELCWALTREQERVWEGRIEVQGELAPERCGCALDELSAMALLAAPGTVRPEAAPAELLCCVAAAERVDWRLLVPEEEEGCGSVVGCIPRERDGDAARDGRWDLLVRLQRSAAHRYLRVAAAAVPVLALAHRDPFTLGDRFVVQVRCQPRIASSSRPPDQLVAPPASTTLVLDSKGEVVWIRRWQKLLEKGLGKLGEAVIRVCGQALESLLEHALDRHPAKRSEEQRRRR
jgi:hypothetical protein